MINTISAFAMLISLICICVFMFLGIINKAVSRKNRRKKKHYFRKALLSLCLFILFSVLFANTSDTGRTAHNQTAAVQSDDTSSGTGRTGVSAKTETKVTVAPTVSPKPTATATPTVKPTATPTAEPTQTVTPTPTATPEPIPTATPTPEPTVEPTVEPTPEPEVGGSLEITMLNVGQGLSILVNQDGHYLLYDGGGRKKSSYVVSYLKQHGASDIEYMIASHYDEDHIAGLVGVLNTATVQTILRPDAENDTKIYNSLINMISKNGAKTMFPNRGDTYSLGNATVTVLAPSSFSEDSNNNSIVVRIQFGEFSCIITGDAETDSEERMVRDGYAEDCVLYIAGHHGSSTSTSSSFLNHITPEYCFISCGSGNSYGHPHQETMDKLQAGNIAMFRSDKQGEVTCTTDGHTWNFSTDACSDWTSGEAENEATRQSATAGDSNNFIQDNGIETSEGTKYVLNTNSKKIHYPSCSSCKTIADHNYAETTQSVDELRAQGYEPCKRCNPR